MVEEKSWEERDDSLVPGFSAWALLIFCFVVETVLLPLPWVVIIRYVRCVEEIGGHGMEVGKSSSQIGLA